MTGFEMSGTPSYRRADEGYMQECGPIVTRLGFSLSAPAPSFPRVRVPMEMKHGEHRNQVVFHREEHAVWKIANERPPSAFLDLLKLGRDYRGVS